MGTILAILITLLCITTGLCIYLAKQLSSVRAEKTRVNHRNWTMSLELEKNKYYIEKLELDLEMERSLSTDTRRELDAAFMNLEMVLSSENSPVGYSGRTFRDHYNPGGIKSIKRKGHW